MRAGTTIAIALGTALFGAAVLSACGGQEEAAPTGGEAKPAPARPVSNIPPLNPKNIVSLAQKSEDHTTLVEAIKAANYVTAVAASGPLTVFAPTDAAFDALPEGTLEDLMKADNADQLREILKYHVTTSALGPESLRDGQTLGMANGAKATIHKKEGELTINGATVMASIPASNGMLHVIDKVLIPPEE